MKQICGSTYEHYKPIQTKTKLECSMSRRRRYVWLTASGGLLRPPWLRTKFPSELRKETIPIYPFPHRAKIHSKVGKLATLCQSQKILFLWHFLIKKFSIFLSLVKKLIDCVLASHKVYFSLQQLTSAFVLCFNIKRKLLIQKTLSLPVPIYILFTFYCPVQEWMPSNQDTVLEVEKAHFDWTCPYSTRAIL